MSFVRSLCIMLTVLYSVYCIEDPNVLLDDCDCDQPLFLTNYINANKFDEAKSLASVKNKEMNDIAPSFAGYLTVNEKFNGNMFFWYFPAALEPRDAPVVLWLEGGPGDSAFISLFTCNGPFIVNANLTLAPRKFSWHLHHHLLYFDNPVGTGYSFTDDDGYVQNEHEVGRDLYEALRQFFTLFSELQTNEFYITGVSYAGKYIPALGYTILNRKQIPSELPKINLVGMSIGNGLTDPLHQENNSEYLYQIGLVDTNGRDTLAQIAAVGISHIVDQDYESAFRILSGNLKSEIRNLTGFTAFNNYIVPIQINTTLCNEFIQTPSSRRAIHVGNKTFHNSSTVLEHLKLDFYQSVADLMSELLSHYRVQLYSGQLDLLVPYPSTENFLQHLNFSGAAEYKTANRTIWHVDDEIAGYMKRAGNLTEFLVRNAGHHAIHDQPKWGLNLLMQLTYGLRPK